MGRIGEFCFAIFTLLRPFRAPCAAAPHSAYWGTTAGFPFTMSGSVFACIFTCPMSPGQTGMLTYAAHIRKWPIPPIQLSSMATRARPFIQADPPRARPDAVAVSCGRRSTSASPLRGRIRAQAAPPKNRPQLLPQSSPRGLRLTPPPHRSPLTRNLRPRTSRLRQPDRDGLFPALHLPPRAPAAQRPRLALMHCPLHLGARLTAISRHNSLLHSSDIRKQPPAATVPLSQPEQVVPTQQESDRTDTEHCNPQTITTPEHHKFRRRSSKSTAGAPRRLSWAVESCCGCWESRSR